MVPHPSHDPGHLHLSLGIVQLLAFAAGALWWPFAGRRTLSDALTRTTVAYRDAGTAGTAAGLRAP